MKRVLVTGATGFVGRVLCETLAQSGYTVRAALRDDRPVGSAIAEKAVVGDIGSMTDWRVTLDDVDFVIHAAARAHVIHDAPHSAGLYMSINAEGTECLANAAARSGVQRFVYLSSIKVNGEETHGHAYTPDDDPRPQDPYGKSKWLGEKAVTRVAAETGMSAVIVRSPLVYGPGVRANFLRLLQIVDAGWPMPLGAIDNKRSLVSVWNLCDLLAHLLTNLAASGGTWMAADSEDLSTPELVRRIGRAMNRRVRLVPVPVGLLKACGGLLGRRAEIGRICGSLVVDASLTRMKLGWAPPTTIDDALQRTVAWYLSEGRLSGN